MKRRFHKAGLVPEHPNCRCIVAPTSSYLADALKAVQPKVERAVQIALGREVQKITSAPTTRNLIQVDEHTSIPGLRRLGEITLEGVLGDTRENLMRAWMDPTRFDKFAIHFPGGEKYEIRGFVTNVKDGYGGAEVRIQPTGPAPKEKKMHPKKMREGLKRFYVGSNSLTPDWTHATMKDAEAHATKLIERDGYEDVFIVEIKRVVRRKKQPVVSEAFKATK